MLVALVLLVLRVLCLSLIFLLIYSGALIITFIFVLMTFDHSDIHCIPSYKFIPALVLYLEGFITMVAYEIGQHGLVLLLTLGRLLGENSRYISFNTIIIPYFSSFSLIFFLEKYSSYGAPESEILCGSAPYRCPKHVL